MTRFSVGDRVRLTDNQGISETCQAPVGAWATIIHVYGLQGGEIVDVKWDDDPRDERHWLAYGLLADRFHPLYPGPMGTLTEQPPADPYNPRNWGDL